MICKMTTTLCQDNEPVVTTSTCPFTDEALEPRPVEMFTLNLYPQRTYQTLEGFGGAMTESAAYTLSLMTEENRKAAIDAYFGPEGLGYRVIRTHIDSCDFSLGHYTAVADPEKDPDFATFTLDRDRKYIIPAIRQAMEAADAPLSVLLSPWSPPACWKTPPVPMKKDPNAAVGGVILPDEVSEVGTRNCGGRLKKEHYGDWARYMVKYIQGYLSEGIPVTMVTIQNEPLAATPWDSCQWTSEEEKTFLRDHLYPAMKEAGLLDKVGIYIWDHNKERVCERACDILDDVTDSMVEGIGFHWYTGDHFEALALTHETFPDKKLIFTEGCVEFSRFGGGSQLSYGQMYGHDLIGDLNAGMSSYFDWNLYLDEKGGPNHVNNFCSAPIMYDGNGGFVKRMTYYYLAHFSRYLKPGAKRIAFSRYTDKLEVTAFKNPDGEIAVVMMNRTGEDLTVNLRLEGQLAKLTALASSISTLQIQ